MVRQAVVVGVQAPMVDDGGEVEPSLNHPQLPTLDFVPDAVHRLSQALFLNGYEVRQVFEPDRSRLGQEVDQALRTASVLHVIGHGQPGRANPNQLHLVPARDGIDRSNDIAGWVAEADNRRHRMLFIVDLCGAGRLARLDWLTRLAGQDTYGWVIAASAPDENAYDGRLSGAVADTLERLARNGLGTDSSRRYVAFSTFARRVGTSVSLMPGAPQHVHATPLDPAQPEPDLAFFANPRFVDNEERRRRQAIQPVLRSWLDDLDEIFDSEHFLSRVGRSFSGRRRQLSALGRWLAQGDGGLCTVTGSPGVGKSAVIGALMCATHPALVREVPQIRERLIADHTVLPPPMPDMAAAHARQRSIAEIMSSLGHQLQLIEPHLGWEADTFADALRRRGGRPIVVIDALDEAQHPAAAARFISTVAAGGHSVLVGMRPWEEFYNLREAAGAVLDLDAVPVEEQRDDIREFLQRSLTEHSFYGQPHNDPLRRHLATATAAQLCPPGAPSTGWGAFLVAAVFVRYLARRPPAADLDGVQRLGASVPRTLPAVFRLHLTQLRMAREFRALLAALAHGEGDGIPVELAAPIAQAFDPAVDELLADELLHNRDDESADRRFYLRTSVDRDGVTLYRLFHQALTDHLRQEPVAGDVHGND